MTENRSDYVLLWKNKTGSPSHNSGEGYCSICRANRRGNHCPLSSRNCAVSPADINLFNNTIHTIIATKDFCNGKQHRCTNSCSTCVIPNTYTTVKVRDINGR